MPTYTREAEKRIDAYVDAVRGLRALEQAQKDDGVTEERSRSIRDAKAGVAEALKMLRGGWLGEARRRLAAEEAGS